MEQRMTKRNVTEIMLSCVAVLAFSCGCTTTPGPTAASICARTEETADAFRVYIGDVDHAPGDYIQQRTEYLKSLADAAQSVDALIGFDDYYTAQDAMALAKDYNAVIDRAYMWPKGETGRLVLMMEDGDLEASIEEYEQQIKADTSCNDPEILKDYQSFLDGKYEVFALVVTAPAKSLVEMSVQADCVRYIDVLHNDEAEEYAKQVGKPVSYLELPSKPDGVG